MRIEILPATEADAPEILALQRLAYQAEARRYGDWSIPPLTQTLEGLREDMARMAVLKAVAADAGAGAPIAGSVRAQLCEAADDPACNPADDGPVCRVGRLIVRPELERRGIGTALLLAVEPLHARAAWLELFTGAESEGNLRLYKRLGYRPVREQAVGPGLTLVFLRKPVPAGHGG